SIPRRRWATEWISLGRPPATCLHRDQVGRTPASLPLAANPHVAQSCRHERGRVTDDPLGRMERRSSRLDEVARRDVPAHYVFRLRCGDGFLHENYSPISAYS